MLRETNYLLPSTKNIKGQKYECLSIIKNDLTKNYPALYQPLDFSINNINSVLLNISYTNGAIYSDEDNLLMFRLDRILDKLNGLCAYYTTSTFITEYCHKEHVRQYDNDYTKLYNQKQIYEDFNLGVFHDEDSDLLKRTKLTP